MSEAQLYSVLLAPHVSEKGTLSARGGYPQYVFKVVRSASKPLIKAAVEHVFNVKVRNVRTVNVKGKSTNYRRIKGRHSDWKKAYISLEQGQEIDVAAGQA